MSKFRNEAVVVEAIQWDGLAETANSFLGENYAFDWEYAPQSSAVVIPTVKGKMRVQIGDWIIRGVKGDFYSCKPEVFEANYEPTG